MPGPQPPPLPLSPPQQTLLQRLAQRQTAPHNLVQRAQIVLAAADGRNNSHIARRLGLSLNTVKRWRRRWNEAAPGLEAVADEPKALEALILDTLSDQPRSGSPPKFSSEQVTEIIALACQTPETFGRPVTHWTARELAEAAINHGLVASISPRQAGRFLKSGRRATAPQPHLAPSRD